MNSKRNRVIGAMFLLLLALLAVSHKVLENQAVAEAAGVQAPMFEVDPLWPKPLPNHWILGNTIGVSVDAQDHVWIIHRGGTLEAKEVYATANPPQASCCFPAPPVLAFDQAGNLIQHWGGNGPGYEWPDSNHGITVDYKGNVWIGGNGRGMPPGGAPAAARGARGAARGVAAAATPAAGAAAPAAGAATPAAGAATPDEGQVAGIQGYFHDSMIMKFTQEGKFLMQIGKVGGSKGSNDVENLRLPAKIFVDKNTNEVYVADGYGNHRVIVFDAETGKYKRHWGAYGNKPDDMNLGPYNPDAPPAQQFRNPVHCAELANDGLVYVCDRSNDRIQVFKKDGTFVKETFIAKRTLGDGSVWDIAFSKDPQQKFIYLVDGANEKIYVIQRDSMEILTSFGDGGRQPGQFYAVHSIATDSKGNIYTTETYRGQRVQRFLYKGLAAVAKPDQGTVWPRK
jgi:DNA-binding beta-propeller fold protein YncE